MFDLHKKNIFKLYGLCKSNQNEKEKINYLTKVLFSDKISLRFQKAMKGISNSHSGFRKLTVDVSLYRARTKLLPELPLEDLYGCVDVDGVSSVITDSFITCEA